MSERLRILIVDDDQSMTQTLGDILAFKGHEVFKAASGPEAIDKARTKTFDLALSDVRMPGMNGAELNRELCLIQPGLPVVLMTAYAIEEIVQQSLEEGVIAVLEKPLDIPNLLNFLTRFAEYRSITVLDDDMTFCQTLQNILEQRGFRVVAITNPHTDVKSMLNNMQILLLDMKLNDIGGLDILQTIRAHDSEVPVLLVTGYQQEMSNAIQSALELGAYACLHKPLVIPELLETINHLRLGTLRSAIRRR
ncbi:MAG: response regulator [Anaerolineales bacterium]|nr:response regulator [Anaerolineales bacterium]